MTEIGLNRYLDHAVLKAEMTCNEAAEAIALGLRYNVRCICVRPTDLATALAMCDGTDTSVGATLGFPQGVNLSASKADEARRYVDLGVDEVDMVAHYGLIRSGRWDQVLADIRAVTEIARPADVVLKVILETSELMREQIVRATETAVAAEADFVKTSTGFASGGATEEAVAAMLETAAGRIGVKASGGIRTREAALRYVEMGCRRLGVGFSTTPVLCDASDAGAPGDSY